MELLIAATDHNVSQGMACAWQWTHVTQQWTQLRTPLEVRSGSMQFTG